MAQAQNMMLNRPTPQALTPEEANNLLQSDDARTINIYGGRTNLEALVKSGIRQKAASKVLGPVAPGPQ
jgi:site-specific recombinase XerD